VVEELLGEVAGLEVADIGCGTGRYAARLAARGARVTGLDFSDAMLERARQKCQGLEPAPRFIAHDVTERLPLPDAAFDRVLSALVVDHIRDLPAHFRELGRICKPGGRIVVSTLHPAMLLRGVEARFVDPQTGLEIRPQSYPNQLSDYVNAAVAAGLLERISEHAVDAALADALPRARKYLGWPLLLVLELRPAVR